MAMEVTPVHVGVDVSKDELVYSLDGSEPIVLPNRRPEIRRWLRGLPPGSRLALEATGQFHLALANEAHRRGYPVYLIDGYRLNRYRDSVGGRAKTDRCDARLLARYLRNEIHDLHPWTPPPEGYFTLQQLLRRRAALVTARVAVQQSLRDVPALRAGLRQLVAQMNRLDALIQKQMRQALERAGWTAQARRCQAIEGIGPLTATALATAFHRGPFRSSDAFIAFLGLDVRIRDSGTHRGRRKLTKKGDPQLRRLLFLAAMQAKAKPAWAGYYQRFIDRGLSPIQALNVLARKLARVAFSLMTHETDYVPKNACAET